MYRYKVTSTTHRVSGPVHVKASERKLGMSSVVFEGGLGLREMRVKGEVERGRILSGKDGHAIGIRCGMR